MERIMEKTSISAIFILSIIFLTGCFQKAETSEEVLKIGSIMPLTGDAASYGIPLRQVAELAVEEINNEGGVNGKKLQIIYEDGKCNGKDATTAAQKLINVDKVKLILGGLCSGETLGAAPIAEENKVILFSPGSGSPDITNSGDYIFRNFPSDATSGNKVAQAAVEDSNTRIAIIAEQTDYAQAVKGVFKRTLENLGGESLTDESYTSESSDFRTQITKMKATEPDAIYVVAQTPTKLAILLRQIDEMGVNQQLYTNEFAAAEDILNEYSKEIEGAIYAEPAFDENYPKAKNLLDNIKNKYGEVSGALPPVYFATTYDGVYILKEAIEDCQGVDATCIRDYLYTIKDREGAAGKLSIDENGDPEFEYVLKTIKDGAPAIAQ